MIEKVEGIILSVVNYGETSKIINVLTKEKGIIGMMAKGAKKLKSPLRSVTDKLTYGIFSIYYKNGRLSILTSVDVLDNFRYIKKDIEKISYATYMLELTSQVLKQSNDSDIYTLLISSLKKINENYSPSIITSILELKYLDKLGVMPSLDVCTCGSDNLKTLSTITNGVVCHNCYTNEYIVCKETLKLIKMFYYVDIEKISKLDVSTQVEKEIEQFLDEYYKEYTGLFLKNKSFINELKKIRSI